ncbi:hypothetical protein SAMN05192585_11361 [Acetanaerobacterium elongatum]|uniref:Uncharacterized protein n=1 Tax=Acetanaerobacterium elongatum TaxID=258515 RepID=A0A1G9ZGZ2_9FIRM|nr:hypothetical protein SAMN05192585_11361 [Acetanaerobacterium elongatum]
MILYICYTNFREKSIKYFIFIKILDKYYEKNILSRKFGIVIFLTTFFDIFSLFFNIIFNNKPIKSMKKYLDNC